MEAALKSGKLFAKKLNRMFKAKLIESKAYYNLRIKQSILMLVPLVPILMLNFYDVPVWISIVLMGGYILLLALMWKNQQLMNSMVGHKLIEVDDTEIRIKAKNGKQQEAFKIDAVEKVILKEEYGIPQESMKEIKAEILGSPKENYLIIQQNGAERKLDFEIDSYYKITQLNKIIQAWMKKGYKVERRSN